MKTGIWNLKFRLGENFINSTKPGKSFFKCYSDILKSGWIFRVKKIEQQNIVDFHTKEVRSYYGTFHRYLNEKKKKKKTFSWPCTTVPASCTFTALVCTAVWNTEVIVCSSETRLSVFIPIWVAED